MSTSSRMRRVLAVGAAAVAVTMISTACSSTSTAATSTATGKPIVLAADSSLLPYNFIGDDGSTWKGIDIDLAAALSKQLKRPITFKSAGFDTIVPGLASGRYDAAMTGMFDTLEREKTVDFVDYLTAKNNFLEAKSFKSVTGMDDLCGVTVGVPSGALEVSLLATASKACVAAGSPEITVNQYKDLNATILALKSGRIQTTPNDSAANAYVLASNKSSFKVSGDYLDGGFFAAAFPKGSTLTARFAKAFDAIIADGSYTKILTKWGIADRAVKTATRNGATF
ncbi:MAG TPA: ABC transporter substrate-binding protein [Lacisediminihabitans sp.]|uniref:ABC transporter substrate-binding protein n=1 Tax=Lacisediminihabitans sp. TaxID=2787631 RepID=UPI002ED8B4BD